MSRCSIFTLHAKSSDTIAIYPSLDAEIRAVQLSYKEAIKEGKWHSFIST